MCALFSWTSFQMSEACSAMRFCTYTRLPSLSLSGKQAGTQAARKHKYQSDLSRLVQQSENGHSRSREKA
jgi:hypothetical protein